MDVDLEVVLEVVAHSTQPGDDVDAHGAQQFRIADTGELKELRGVDRAAAQHHFTRLDRMPPAQGDVVDSRRARAGEPDARGEGEGVDVQVRAVHHGMEVCPCRRQPSTPVNRAVERAEALLAIAVDVVGSRVARLDGGVEEGAEEGILGRAAFEDEGPLAAAPLIRTG